MVNVYDMLSRAKESGLACFDPEELKCTALSTIEDASPQVRSLLNRFLGWIEEDKNASVLHIAIGSKWNNGDLCPYCKSPIEGI